MIIQPLLRPGSEPSSDGRTSTDGESPNEMFARALAESIQAARHAGPDASRRSVVEAGGRARFERADNRVDPRSETAVTRSDGTDRPVPTRPSVDRPDHADDHRADEHRADDHRAGDGGHDRTGTVEVGRPGDPDTDRPGAQVVDPAGDPVRPGTPGSDNGRRVAFANETERTDQSGNLDVQDSPLATALASLMGVDAEDAAAFLHTLMTGLTRSQGVESAEELMSRLTALADRLGGGDTATGLDGADTDLVAAVVEAAVDAGLVEPMTANADTDPTALLAALTSAIAGGGTDEPERNGAAVVDAASTAVDGAKAGGGHAPAGLDSAGGAGEPTMDPTGSSGSDDSLVVADTTAENTPSDGTGDTTVSDVTGDGGDSATVEDGAGDGAGSAASDRASDAATDGADTAATDGIALETTMARAGDTSTGMAPSATPSGIGAPAGVSATGPTAAPTQPAAATPTPAQGLVELANNQLAEQLRPAFAAVRRGIDGLEELRLRLRNEGGAPIRVDISTVDNEVRVVLSGTNEDVMQRLGQERERLADELRRAGFTSTSIDVRSEGADADNRRPGTPAANRSRGGTYDTTEMIEDDTVGAVVGPDRSTTTSLDLDL